MKPILLATHEYRWALFPFAHLFQKYWESAGGITWYGDRLDGPVPDGVEYRQVPAYREGIWNWHLWFGDGLRSILAELEDDIIAILLPDHWIYEPVDVDGVSILEKHMRGHGRVLRGNLAAGTCLDGRGEIVGMDGRRDLVSIAPTDRHCSFGGGMTFCPSLWSRDGLLRLLESHWSLWDCEKLGTEKFARELWPLGWMSVGMRPAPLKRCHGLSHAAPRTANLSALSAEDRAVVRGMLPGGWDVLA